MSYGTSTFDGKSIRRVAVVGSAMDYVKPYHDTKEDDTIAKEKKRGAIRDAITTFADTTTAHGIPLIINGTYTLARIAWALLWLVAIGVAFIQAYSLLYEYFVMWPTTTNIELVTNTNSKFPAVTLCNMNRIRRSKVVGTRFEGLVAIDGGVSGGDYDYSWFFDWSSNWFNDWTPSSSDGSSAIGGTGANSDDGTGVGSSGGNGASSDGGTGVGSSDGTGLTSSEGTGASSGGGNTAGDAGDASSAGTGANTGAGTGASADTGSSAGDQGSIVGGMSSVVDPNASMTTNENSFVETSVDNSEGNTGDMSGVDGSLSGSSVSTTNTIGTATGTSSTSTATVTPGSDASSSSSAKTVEIESGGSTTSVSTPTVSSDGSAVTDASETTTVESGGSTTSVGTPTVSSDGSAVTDASETTTVESGGSTTSVGTPTVSSDGSAVTDTSGATTVVANGGSTTSVGTPTVANGAASSSAVTSTINTVTTMSSLSTVASATDGSSAMGGGSASSAADSGRRRRSTDLDTRRRRSLGSSSSSSSSFNLFGSSNSDFDFQYYDYYNWDDVADENDWRGFYEKSTADDFSDLVDVVNPTRDELEAFGHQADNFILQCTFDKKKCNYTDFRVTQNKDYGNCFTFNHGTGNDTVRYTSKSGAKYGLHLTIWIEQPEYIGILTPESGARLTVHDQRTMPTPEDEGITVAPGLATSIGVRQDYIERQPHPFGNCSTDPSQTDFPGNEYYDYSVGACTKYCLQNALLRRCGCVTDLLIDSAAKCSYINSTQQMCRQAVDALYESNRLECKCPTACNETTYRLGISSSRWPSERYEEHLYSRVSQTNANAARLLLNAEQTKKNVLRLRVYFEELNYQSIIQSPKYSIEGLLGALGGLFGLYVGFSVITMAEALVFIVKLVKIVLCISPKCKSEITPTA